MMRNFLDKYLPVFQAPDAPAPAASGSDPSGGAGGSSSPASEPSAPQPNSGVDTPSGSTNPDLDAGPATDSVDFSSIFNDGLSPTPPAASPQPQAETPLPPATLEPKPPVGAEPAQPAKAPEAPKAGDTPPSAAPATSEPSSAPTAQLDPSDPGALAQALVANEAAAVQHIADTMFKLTPEQIEELETNTVAAVPKLLAKVLYMSQVNFFRQMSRLVPTMMDRHTTVTQKYNENESKFYAAWPDLKKDQHGELVRRLGIIYRQNNPQASFDQMVQELGPMVMMAAKVAPSAPRAAAPAAAPGVPPVRSAQPTPFTPAAPVAGGASVPPPVQESHPAVAIFEHQDG